ncbi:hypothetical protein [Bradyrhizobium sp. sGM-13]|uniref:hypothetical protein n=1 Tax=Bradyrhizobium sp. sGM-13 TaxID=2831781 RepID=UPI001BCF74EB|nr:hypothetical protein [Bradyrhizobium sp. sGM-13]
MPDTVSNEVGRTRVKMRSGNNDSKAENDVEVESKRHHKEEPVSRSVLEKVANKAAETGRLDLTEIPTPLAAADIATSVQDFHSAASVLMSMQMPYPMVHISAIGWAPLDLPNSVPEERRSFASPADIVGFAREAPGAFAKTEMLLTTMPVPQARRSFAALLVDFLRVRVDAAMGLRVLSGGENLRCGVPEVPGLDVTVHNLQTGLRIIAAKAYFPDVRRVFGNSLSTPVSGYLPPGKYIFGADGPNRPLVLDDTVPYEIPPNNIIHMVRP